MLTICSFIPNQKDTTHRNPVFTRTLGRVGFVDSGYSGTMPRPSEHWLCKLQRENLAVGKGRGSFVVLPVEKVDQCEYLQINQYELAFNRDVVVVLPQKKGSWVMSPNAKHSILTAARANGIIISLDLEKDWERRAPPEEVLTGISLGMRQ